MRDHSPPRSARGMADMSSSVCMVPPEKVPRILKKEVDFRIPAPGLTDWS